MKIRVKNMILATVLIAGLILSGCNIIRKTDTGKDENVSNPIVTMEIKDRGTIKIELYPEVAPNTVNNFISLVEDGFYDGVIFHRVIPGFMIQGGDPEGTGTGGPGYSIKGEFADNGFKNDLSHTAGVVSMARTLNDMDSAGSQFFIMVSDNHAASLDGSYAAFGKVIEGLDIAVDISKVSRDEERGDKPWDDVIIEKVTVDTFGRNYPKPKKIK